MEQLLKRQIVLSLIAVLGLSGASGALEPPAPRRVALVIGNGPAGAADGPLADARAVSQALQDLGFDRVIREENVTKLRFARAVDALASTAGSAEVALLYYAGQVVEVEGENYLLCADSAATSRADIPYEAYAARRALAKLREAGAKARVLVLDADRPHPLAAGGGLAPMAPGGGELIAFSTAPGRPPAGPGDPFARELVGALKAPGLGLRDVFERVRERVSAASKGAQVPGAVDALAEPLVLNPARTAAVPVTPAPVTPAATAPTVPPTTVPPTTVPPTTVPPATAPAAKAGTPPVSAPPATRPAPRTAASVTGHVEVLDKGGQRASDLSEAVVWIDDIKGKPARTAPATITMRGKSFTPHVVVVPVGGSVDFPNDDPILHNVFSVAGENRFDLDLYKRPKSGTWTAKAPGLVRVYCNIHPQMSAVVVVRDGPFFAKVGADGSFLLEGVPPGKHVLKGWHERGGEASVEVVVPAEGSVSADLKLDAAGFKKEPHKNKFGKDYGPGEKY